MANNINPEQKQGMSTRKKWLIGCGGCLGVVLIVAIALAVLAGMGVNALKDVSNESVSAIFGKDFKPEPNTAMGLPLGQKELKNMVFMFDQKRGLTVFAIDTEVSPTDARLLKSGDSKQIETFLKHMSEEATSHNNSSSSARLRDIHFNATGTVTLPNGKHFPVSKATMEAEKRGETTYSPTVAALIPEANNRLITIIALEPNSASSEPDTDFSHAQANLQTEVVRLVSNSALDDRLISTQAIQSSSSAKKHAP
jgi:hypothetical protein